MKLVQGNEAVALGAMAAGCTFYAGYPITPASEIMEWMARLLPAKGGVFLQMEDEIASMAAVIGATWAGGKAMTATSGPGFSLMQEHIGYAAQTETPCVIVDAQRGGPSTGLPTLPSQGDAMQAAWGSHGDRTAIVLSSSSVLDAYLDTVRAFNLSERYRQPVVLLLDATLAHMRENIEIPQVEVWPRKEAVPGQDHPFGSEEFMSFGAGRVVVTGLAHEDSGLPRASDGALSERMLLRIRERIENDIDEIAAYRALRTKDAEFLLVAYGITARAARAAVNQLRSEGFAAGLLELRTLWPFPERLIQEYGKNARFVLIPELNLGQMAWPVRAALADISPVHTLGRADGHLFTADEIAQAVRMNANNVPSQGREMHA